MDCVRSSDDTKFASRLPGKSDGCTICCDEILERRRYSTETPSIRICKCGLAVYEIHNSCLDCAEKDDSCPWCSATPWMRKVSDKLVIVDDFEEDGL